MRITTIGRIIPLSVRAWIDVGSHAHLGQQREPWGFPLSGQPGCVRLNQGPVWLFNLYGTSWCAWPHSALTPRRRASMATKDPHEPGNELPAPDTGTGVASSVAPA
jgi:hypothetical protein